MSRTLTFIVFLTGLVNLVQGGWARSLSESNAHQSWTGSLDYCNDKLCLYSSNIFWAVDPTYNCNITSRVWDPKCECYNDKYQTRRDYSDPPPARLLAAAAPQCLNGILNLASVYGPFWSSICPTEQTASLEYLRCSTDLADSLYSRSQINPLSPGEWYRIDLITSSSVFNVSLVLPAITLVCALVCLSSRKDSVNIA